MPAKGSPPGPKRSSARRNWLVISRRSGKIRIKAGLVRIAAIGLRRAGAYSALPKMDQSR